MPVFSDKSNSFRRLLENASWRALRGYAWYAKFTFHHHQKREGAVAELAKHLAKETVIKRLLSSTSERDRELLEATLAGEGAVTQEWLESRGGPIRVLNYQRVADAPWRDPQNASEALVYRGLLLPDAQKENYYIADELIPTLQGELLPITAAAETGRKAMSKQVTPSVWRHDLLMLLLYVQRHSPKVLSKHRLPITAVRALDSLLANGESKNTVRSHTQHAHLWFLSKLARKAGLIEAKIGDRFWLTAAALRWLVAEKPMQISHLWHSLPVALDWPPPSWPNEWHELFWPVDELFGVCCTKLASLPVAQWVTLGAWEAAAPAVLKLSDWARYELPPEQIQIKARQLFFEEYLRPFVVLGVIEFDQSREHLRLTSLGAHLLPLSGQPLNPAQVEATAQQIAPLFPETGTPPNWRLDAPKLIIPNTDSLPLTTIWQLAPFTTPICGGATLEFELTSATVADALGSGYGLNDLRHALEAGGLPLTKDLLPTHPTPHIRAGYWLETDTPKQLDQLQNVRSVRLALRNGKKFSPRHHTIDPRYLASLQKSLQDIGQPAIVDVPTNDPLFDQSAIHGLLENPRRHRVSTNGLLLLAVRLWQRENSRIKLKYAQSPRPRPLIPQALVQALDGNLNSIERAAVEQIWQETLDLLDPTIWDAPAVVAEADDGKRHLTGLQQAIDNAHTIQIEYEPAGKATSKRTIEPHYLEKRRDLWYLHAYCRKAQDKRQFRLDRIRSLSTLQSK